MKIAGIRSPGEKLAGLYHLGRLLDKLRLFHAGTLPTDYHRNLGMSVGLDGHLCGFLGIEFTALSERVKLGGTDEEIVAWCFTQCPQPNKIQKRVWNEFARKFGWNDAASKYLTSMKAQGGVEHRTDLATAFDVINHDEGHDRPSTES